MALKLPIFLDNHSTTPCDPRVVDAMLPYFTERFGNAASRNHAFGWTAEQATEIAREQVAALIGASAKEIVWTSGATEAINLALKGAAEFYKDRGNHIITVQTEHKATLDSCKRLEKDGFEVTYLPVDSEGRVSAAQVKAAMTDKTILVSVMLANNEIGSIHPVNEIGQVVKDGGALFAIDAVQGAGKIPFDVNACRADLVALSAHKMYGPKGVGALYVRRKPRVRLEAQMHGGGHEKGLRSGTLPTHQIVGMGEAFRLARLEMATENERIRMLRDRLLAGVKGMEEVYVNGDLEQRVPHNLNVSFNFVEGESLIMGMKELAVSSGSACTSASLEPSYVLRALGRNDELAHSSIRFTIGRWTTEADIDFAVKLIHERIGKLREMSPLWEMFKEGIDLNTVQWAAH